MIGSTIYIDLDHTLLNTEAYKKALAQSIKPLGISHAHFFVVYKKLRKHFSFSIPKMAEMLSKDVKERAAICQLLGRTTVQAVRPLLYPDVLPFLLAMKKKGVRFILFTYGDPAFQRMKIAGIPRYRSLFERVIVTKEKTKRSHLVGTAAYAGIIDNRVDVVQYYARRYGMIPFLLIRDRARLPRNYRATIHRSLRTIGKILNEYVS